MKRSIVRGLAALVVLGLVLGLLLLSRNRGGEGAQLDAAAGAEAVAASPAHVDPEARTESVSSNESARESAPENLVAEAPAEHVETVLVRVVDSERFEPVVGAEVRWASWNWINDDAWRDAQDRSPISERVKESGLSGVTDSEGCVRIGTEDSLLFVQASTPGHWGHLRVAADEPERVDLVLAPDGDLWVEVIDAAGRPVEGVQVGAMKASSSSGFPKVVAKTGPDGLARLVHARADVLEGDESPELVVSAISNDPEAPRVVIESSPWPTSPVRLRIGASGTLVVRVLDRSGSLVGETTSVNLTPILPRSKRVPMHQASRAGYATFVRVPLGQRFLVTSRPMAGVQDVCTGDQVSGPRTEGERVEVVSTLCSPNTEVAGRALDVDGTPIVHAKLNGSIREASHLPPLVPDLEFDTDEAGNFRVPLPGNVGRGGSSSVLLLRKSGATLEGSVGIPATVASGVLEVGDVRLSPPPLLIAGRVQDENGSPIPRAVVNLRRAVATTGASPELETLGYGASEMADDRLRSTRCDAQGRFELRVPDPVGPYRAKAYAPGFAQGPDVPFEVGATDVVLFLRREIEPLRGRVLVSSRDSLERLSVSGGKLAATLDSYGRFTIPRKSGEPVDVVVRAETCGSEPVVTIVGVTDPNDPRLAPLDLRPLVREFRFRVVGPDRVPLPLVHVVGRSQSGQRWQLTVSGVACLLSRDSTLDLDVGAEGFLPKRFVGVLPGDVLQLELMPVLRLRVSDALPEAGEELSYQVRLLRDGARKGAVTIQWGREQRWPLPELGTWTLEWTVHGSTTPLQQTDVVVGSDGAECVLDVSPRAVEAARNGAKTR